MKTTGTDKSYQTNNLFSSSLSAMPGDRRFWKYTSGLGFLLALSFVLGSMLTNEHRTCRSVAEIVQVLSVLFVMTFMSSIVTGLLFMALARLRDGGVKSRISGKEYDGSRVSAFYTAAILLCWLPVFLAYYPSVFAYDAEGQLYQVLAHDYSTHHPLLHTLFLGAFFQLGKNLPGSCSSGMALHSIVQMFLMAVILGYALAVLYREKTSWAMRFLLFLFYALFPANSVLSVSTTKDVLFSGLVLLYVIKVYQWCGGQDKKSKGFAVRFVLISAAMLLFRNNALYAWICCQPFLFRFAGKRKMLKQYAVIAAATIMLFGMGSAGLKTATAAHSGSPREMLSVPLQQMARTRVMHEEELDDEMRRKLDSYLPSEWVFAAYNPHLADPVKNRAVIHDDPAGLMKTWARLGLRYPMTYVDAFLDNSLGCWYLADKTHSTIYGVGTESGFGYLSTDNREMPAGYEIIRHSYLPGFRAFMERIVSDNEYQKIPVVSVLFAPAFYWWMLCVYIAFFLYRREYGMLAPALFPVLYYLTLLLSPTVLVRYMYPFMLSSPMMLCLVSAKKRIYDAPSLKIDNKN
ncbi:MAG: DUF6020 family protein [Blautia sp.]|nr:DUF6020 family protein [Blautia sp.]MCM1201364.1 DUF6020 family protein [Bacteroides fragilis]